MTRAKLKEQFVDKLILGALSSIFLALILFNVNRANEQAEFVRENSKARQEFSRTAYEGYLDGINSIAYSYRLYRSAKLKSPLDDILIRKRVPILLALAALSEKPSDPKQQLLNDNLLRKMRDCDRIVTERMTLSNLKTISPWQAKQIMIDLQACGTNSLLDFSRYYEALIKEQFLQGEQTWGEFFATASFLRPQYVMLLLMALILGGIVVVVYRHAE